MTTTRTEPDGYSPSGIHRSRRAGTAMWVWILGGGLVIVICSGAALLFAWIVDETHFDRPSAEFDELTGRLDSISGVSDVESNRWVEAPTFSNPTSWVGLSVNQDALPALLDAACTSAYPDAVTWSIRVHTESGTTVALHGSGPASSGSGERCADFGFEPVPLVAAIDRVVPGQSMQPAIWDDGRFALVAVDDGAGDAITDYRPLLPLVSSADDLRRAGGLGGGPVEINAATLGLTIGPRDAVRYVSLLDALARDHAVSAFWVDAVGTTTDGVERVQLVAPEREHAAIERVIASSGLGIAELPVRFLEP